MDRRDLARPPADAACPSRCLLLARPPEVNVGGGQRLVAFKRNRGDPEVEEDNAEAISPVRRAGGSHPSLLGCRTGRVTKTIDIVSFSDEVIPTRRPDL